MQPRRGEELPPHQRRSGRFVETEEGWYFKTREGIAVGPYPTEFDAEVCASLLTARLAQLDRNVDVRGVIRDFLSDPASGPRSAQFRKVDIVDWRERMPKSPPAHALARMSELWKRARSAILWK
jgi:hypothetical protein